MNATQHDIQIEKADPTSQLCHAEINYACESIQLSLNGLDYINCSWLSVNYRYQWLILRFILSIPQAIMINVPRSVSLNK